MLVRMVIVAVMAVMTMKMVGGIVENMVKIWRIMGEIEENMVKLWRIMGELAMSAVVFALLAAMLMITTAMVIATDDTLAATDTFSLSISHVLFAVEIMTANPDS